MRPADPAADGEERLDIPGGLRARPETEACRRGDRLASGKALESRSCFRSPASPASAPQDDREPGGHGDQPAGGNEQSANVDPPCRFVMAAAPDRPYDRSAPIQSGDSAKRLMARTGRSGGPATV